MGRAPCCSKVGLHRGPWSATEDALLIKYIEAHGEGQWRSMPKKAGLLRCGKSCRLRWMNYLRPDIKRGNITQEEDDLIIRLHGLLGNKWSLIAGRLPGRTDNEIKNYWNTHLSKRLRIQGTDPNTHKKLSESELKKLTKHRRKRKCRKMKIQNPNEQVIYDKGLSVDNNNNNNSNNNNGSGIIEERTKIHLPRPVRVNSVISLTRNNSNESLETSASATSSQNQTLHQIHGLTGIYDSENNNFVFDMPWVSNNAYIGSNGLDDHMMMTIGSSCDNNHRVNIDIMQSCDYNGVVDASDNSQQQLEKLYEEYLQLIKVDYDHDHDHHHHYDNDVDGVGETQLDSFTKSFLI